MSISPFRSANKSLTTTSLYYDSKMRHVYSQQRRSGLGSTLPEYSNMSWMLDQLQEPF